MGGHGKPAHFVSVDLNPKSGFNTLAGTVTLTVQLNRCKIFRMEKALELLNQDYYLNYPLIRALKYGARLVHADQDGVAVLKPQYNFYLVTGINPMAFVNKIVSPELIELCGSRCALHMKAHCNLETVLECHQYYYLHAAIQSDLPLEKLTPSDAEFVFDHYDLADPEEVVEAIEQGRMFGVRDNGKLFAFIGLHGDYSMGMLEVLPAYRRQGWGEKLERALIAHLLSIGELPYGHVITGNDKSTRLQEKLGFTLCSDTVTWMW